MGIVRSLSLREQPKAFPNPNVRVALQAWERRVAAAEERGRAAARAELEAEIAAADGRVQAAERACEERVAQQQADLDERWATALQALGDATRQLQDLQSRALAEAEQDIVHLALAVAARVLRHEVEADPAWMVDLLREVQAQLPGRRPVRVELHPDDCVRLQERLVAATPAGGDLPDLVPAAALTPGSCQVLTGGTMIDAGIATSWERLAAVLEAAAPRTAPSGVLGASSADGSADGPAADAEGAEP